MDLPVSTPLEPAGAFATILKQETKRRIIEESLPRIKKCLLLLDEKEIWHKPNTELSSIGNLVLHLCGNARQWIICTLGNQSDSRNREEEFNEKGPLPTSTLLHMLEQLAKEIILVLEQLTPEKLLQSYQVQCYTEPGVSILVHVIEHFSYHVGQISYITKEKKALDLGYYQGQKLNQTYSKP